MDVVEGGVAAGSFLRAHVSIPITKPLMRFITTDRGKGDKKKDERFSLQYEKPPFFCFSYGVMGHSELECPNPTDRDDGGKLWYDNIICAPEMKRKGIWGFAAAANFEWSSNRNNNSGSCSGSHGTNSIPRTTPQAPDVHAPIAEDDITSLLKAKASAT